MATERKSRGEPSQLRVGCCGIPAPLHRYACDFPVVEVQQTFYQPPQLKTLAKWRAQVPTDFEFTLKAWQLITHESTSLTYRRLREKLTGKQRREAGAFRPSDIVMSAWKRTLECALAQRSRAILFQCSARFTPIPEHKARVRDFFCEVRKGFVRGSGADEVIFVWEPRGNWKPEEVRELCEEVGLVHGVDPFRQLPVTQGLAYFRLHGRSGYCYRFTDNDLGELLAAARPFRACYVLFNNISMFEDAGRFVRFVRA